VSFVDLLRLKQGVDGLEKRSTSF